MSLLELRGINKRFGATHALAQAEFTLAAGEVHALVGANGAGKSTLSRVIAGYIRPDRGEMTLDGEPLHLSGSRDALRHGICMVTQETTLAPDLGVIENIMLPRLGMSGRLDWHKLRQEAEALLATLGGDVRLPLDATVGSLSISQLQIVEILKALALNSRIIIFDEPTSSLSPMEREQLFGVMRDLAARGHALIFVSHRMEEIFTVTDRVTVMREGRTVAKALPTNSLDIGKLVELMVGQAVSDIYSRNTAPATRSDGAVALRVSHLACPPMVRDVSFQVRHGEIVALAGLVGAGRSETVETIFGLRRPTGGTIELEGKPFQANWPVQAIRAGIGLIPEDRRRQGIVPDFSVRENLLLAHLGNHDGFGLGYDKHRGHILDLLELLGLPSHRLLDASLLNFSGGMQQKIIVARWLLLNPKVLLLDEPTRGVDIGTRSSIYALLRRVATDGVAVVVVSSDFEEVIGLADRIVVMSDGVSVSEQPSELLTVGSLTMFAAPRSSAQRTHATLESLVQAYGGIAAWIEQEGGRVFCFDRAGDDAAADPGFAAGSIHEAAELVIAPALRERAGSFVACEGGRSVLLVPIIGRRGHELGLVCLCLPPGAVPPAAEAAASMVTARLSVQKTQVMTGEAA